MSVEAQGVPGPSASFGGVVRAWVRARLTAVQAAAAVLAVTALAVSRGEFDPAGLALMTAALILACATALVGGAAVLPARDEPPPVRLLAIVAVLSCVWHVILPPGSHLSPPQPDSFRVPAAVAAVVCATWLLPSTPAWLARSRFWIAIACFAAMAIAVIVHSPGPFIDVWWIQQQGASALLDGANPYAVTYPNYYGHTLWYAPELIEHGRIAFYPYPPLTLTLGTLGYAVAGDVRFAFAAAVLLAGWLVRRIGGRSGVAETAALVLLFQPVAFLMVEKAWTEPALLLATGVTVWAMRRRGDDGSAWWTAAAAGLLAASKQYSFLIAIPLAFALPRRRRVQALVLAAALALATLVPFAVWNPAELWRDLVTAQVLQPFRFDALSWLVVAARAVGHPLPSPIGFVAPLVVLGATVRPGATIAQAVRAASAGLLAFFLFNKQAFANYYWCSAGVLLLATVLSADRGTLGSPAPPVNADPS